MKIGLDTSVVVRLICGEPRELAESALHLMMRLKEQSGRAIVSDLVVAESYYALQHHYGVSKADALAALKSLFDWEAVECLGEASKILALARLARANPGFVDRVIHQQYLIGGADEVATFEKSAKSLSHIKLVE
ncbi:MAG TPA: hypothetical protein DCZ95_02285 [Verrucomicrobia bacterium]|nr:MAG: hypothetical protein A2X46_00560 [Lentisphaerae bacterium GWF2_57_35]HBA82900.1 hypothetical protein [Verrucomicrobiota bacterium]